jgi:hypothetical protein
MQEKMEKEGKTRIISDKIKLGDDHMVHIPDISFKNLNEA